MNTDKSGRTVPKFIFVLFACQLVLCLLYVHAANFSVHHSWYRLVDLSGENNLPTWFSSFQLTLVAMMFTLFFVGKSQRGEQAWAMLIAAAGFLLLSLDETAELHERIGGMSDALLPGGDRDNTSLHRTGIWMFVLAPVALICFWLWWRNAQPYLVGFKGKGKLILGLITFVAAATVPEFFSNFVEWGPWMHLAIAIEEIGEMAGITIFLWGVFELCVYHRIRCDFDRGLTSTS